MGSVLLLVSGIQLMAQGFPPTPVEVTEARSLELREEIRLSGTVESRRASGVAAPVAGLVREILVEDGDYVERGRVLVRLDQQLIQMRIDAAKGNLKEAEARLKLAENGFERAKELHKAQVYSNQELDNDQFEVGALLGRIDNLAALIRQNQFDLQRSEIRAPFAGIVTRKATEMGEWLTMGEVAMELTSLDQLDVVVDVPERFYSFLSPGGDAHITFQALGGLERVGRIRAVIPEATASRTFPVKISFDNADRTIPVGILADVSIRAGKAYTATVVPKDAVLRMGPEKRVFVVGTEQTVSSIAVQTGRGAGQWVEIIGELSPGQRVVTLGNERLQPGQSVNATVREYALP